MTRVTPFRDRDRLYLVHEKTIVIKCRGRGRAADDGLTPGHKVTTCGRLHFRWIEDPATGQISEPTPSVRSQARHVYQFDDGRQVPLAEETAQEFAAERARRVDSIPEQWRDGDSPAARAFLAEAERLPDSHTVHEFECQRCAPALRIDLRELHIDVRSAELREILDHPGVSTLWLPDLITRFSIQ